MPAAHPRGASELEHSTSTITNCYLKFDSEAGFLQVNAIFHVFVQIIVFNVNKRFFSHGRGNISDEAISIFAARAYGFPANSFKLS